MMMMMMMMIIEAVAAAAAMFIAVAVILGESWGPDSPVSGNGGIQMCTDPATF